MAALLVAFYAAPAQLGLGAGEVVGILLTLLAIAVLGWAIARQVRAQMRDPEGARVQSLFWLLGLVVIVFATTFAYLENTAPAELDGIATRTDALYFTLSTLTTVGFGDVHAVGQLARALVSLQLVFDVVFVAALVSTIGVRLRQHGSLQSPPPDAGPPTPDGDSSRPSS